MKASLSLLSKVELFSSLKQRVVVATLFLLIFTLSLCVQYFHFKTLTTFDDYITNTLVLKQYKKKSYWVLQLKSEDGFVFYTSSRDNLKPLEGEVIKVQMFVQDLEFLSFLKGFYARTQFLSPVSDKQKRYLLMKDLEVVHTPPIASVYKALFYAGTIPPVLRQRLSALGINHLLAISGFHLGVLSMLLFFILRLLYKPLCSQFFPYRNINKDIAFFVFIPLFAYVYFLDFTPSLLRAFSMSLFAYILYDRGIKILSFSSLFLVIGFLIALWPKLIFALGFWFSVAGVFYIFVFLHYMKGIKVWQTFILIHFWVYITMLPLVHYFFGSFSLEQLYSPVLSMGFIIFYPLSLFLHLIGQGARLDFLLEHLLKLDIVVVDLFIPLKVFIFYLFISILSVFHKIFFYFLFFFSVGVFGYFLYGVTKF